MASPVILVVDDDRATATFLVTVLEDAGYGVLAATGAEALRLAREQQPALMLLDRRMPEIDGREMATIPLVLMTADAHDREEIAAAMDDWLAKPFHLATLFATLARWAPVG